VIEKAHGGLITGAVIGSFVGIVLIIIIVYFVAFRKKNTIASASTNLFIYENNWYGNICLYYHYIAHYTPKFIFDLVLSVYFGFTD
jgi:hypothetical protein